MDRSKAHKRKLVVTPIMSFSDDKRHDTYYVQQCLEQEALKSNGQVHIILSSNEQIDHLHVDSDNAAGHFKSKFTLQHDAKIIGRVATAFGRDWRLSWGFGYPNHGKGCWDGFRGVIKSWTTKRIITEDVAFSPDREGKKALRENVKENFNKTNKAYNKMENFLFT